MRILVTGSTGFIGSELCSYLQNNHQVFVDKKIEDPTSPTMILNKISNNLQVILNQSNIEVVVHLAAKTPLKNDLSPTEKQEYFNSNLVATQNLANQCVASHVKRFIFMSSVKVLGEGKDSLYSIEDDPSPIDDYAKSKWQAEQFLLELGSRSDMEIVIIRAPLVYGPGVKGNFLKLIQLVKKGIPFPFGLIQNRRSMIYVGNLVDALERCMTHPNAVGKTYLVSDGYDISTPEIIRSIARALNQTSRLIPIPIRLLKLTGALLGKNEAMRRLVGSLALNIEPIKKDLNWTPPYILDEGMARTIQWYLSKK
jgi:nucleoside-diphosphate-sugar epimerase